MRIGTVDRRLRRQGLAGGAVPTDEQWRGFLAWVEGALTAAEDGRRLMERSLQLTSDELREALDEQARRQAVELESEALRLEAVISSFGDGIVILDDSERIVYANAQAHRLLHEPAVTLAGLRLQDVLSRWDAGHDRPLTPGAELVREEHVELVGRARIPFPASYTLAPIGDDNAGWVLGFSDVSETEQVRRDLHRQAEYTSALLASMQDGLTVYGPEGRLIEANRRFCEMTGFTREELVGAHAPPPYLPGVSFERIQRTFQRVREKGALEMEHTYTCRDGSVRPVLVAISTFHTGDDEMHYVATVKDITDRKRVEAELVARAATDDLTGLANHRAFQERLVHEVRKASENNRPVAVMLIDIDHFKRVNDSHGHLAGDAVLVELSARLRSLCRDPDFVARNGGEEFAWILQGMTGPEATRAAERIRDAIARSSFAVAGRLTVSIGVCGVETDDPEEFRRTCSAEHLLRGADLALYWSKGNGRDRVSLYDAKLAEAASAEDLRTRIERAERLGAIEALARAVDARDPATHHHSTRVAELASRLAETLGWASVDVQRLYEAGLVHDVGKLGVPDAILLKPDHLDPLEYEQIKSHAATGAQMVTGTLDDEQVAWIRGHHERFDGRGYPDGLEGSRISSGARILAAADAWDAMTFARAYSHSRSPAEALEECRRETGRQFCPEVVTALGALFTDEARAFPGISDGETVPRPLARAK